MRAFLKNSTSLSLAALACAILLFAAPFDAAMARGAGTGGGAGAGSGGGHGGPSVRAFDAVVRPPTPPTIVNGDQVDRSPSCSRRANRMGLTGGDRIAFLNTCQL
jgi:hypothetical protein